MNFSEFPHTSYAEWLAQVLADLKGTPAEALDWDTGEGIILKPYYTLEQQPFPAGDHLPVRRAGYWQSLAPGWQPVQEINLAASGAAADIQAARDAEVHAFWLRGTPDQLAAVIPGIPLHQSALHLGVQASPASVAAVLRQALADQGTAPDQLTGTWLYDRLASALPDDHAEAAMTESAASLAAADAWPWFRPLCVDTTWVYEQGGTLVQQLALALGLTVEYVHGLQTRTGQPAAHILSKLAVCMPVGSLFFLEIAKFRALRVLYTQVAEVMGATTPEAQAPFVVAVTGQWNKSRYDAPTNLLRLTTETLSAALGGVQSLITRPYRDNPDDPAAARLSRNIHHLLQHEAVAGQVADAVGGAYYIEAATDALITAAWELFQRWESAGGCIAAWQQGLIPAAITAAAATRARRVRTRQQVLTGINQYPDQSETLPDPMPTPDLRGGAVFEHIRQRADAWGLSRGQRLTACILGWGDPALQNARRQFARNLLGCGGWVCQDIDRPESDDFQSLPPRKPDLIVLCAADADYTTDGPALIAALQTTLPEVPLVLAGKPEAWSHPALRHHIYAGMDAARWLDSLVPSSVVPTNVTP
ncbi:MAG: methylmalonyl-CoA mutase family protein [Bacteroidia bacterium]|nr:methylmalonyl-CoA mutase family protein [Bacteroidia bacterium]